MIHKNNQERRQSMWDVLSLATLRYAEALSNEENFAQATPAKMRERGDLTPKEAMQRGLRAWTFTYRLKLATRQNQSVDTMLLEVTEAVAAHWRNVRVYYGVVVMGNM